MRLRTRTWLVISVLSLVGAAVFWRLGEQRLSRRAGRPEAVPAALPASPAPAPAKAPQPAAPSAALAPQGGSVLPATFRLSAAATNFLAGMPSKATREALRLRNTTRPAAELERDDHALLLRNALIDTADAAPLPIPAHLRSGEEPGSFVVQSDGPITPVFRSALASSGLRTISYLPNNAYLVEASSAQARQVAALPGVRAVLPFEPYFKLEPALLNQAIRQEESNQRLILTLLPGAAAEGAGREAVSAAGAEVQGEFPTPFGPALLVQPRGASLASLARLPAVQGIELHRERQLMNDLARRRLGISGGTNAPLTFTNYLGLTGTNVFVNINDTGVDATHPDLIGRVTGDVPATLIDTDGHGTHVAATIAGSGKQSLTVSNAPGSLLPGADFRGMAPAAELYAQPVDLTFGPFISDAYLQQAAATNYYITQGRTNLPISHNSWGYPQLFEYSVAAASFDAAVRDALPDVPGAQPIAYVFSAGNEGFGGDDGQGGEPGTVHAPGSGKNVITVGALESPRNITNEVVYIDDLGQLQTNQIFLARTDTDFQVSSFSSRGNVEPGIEGRNGRFKPDVVAPGSFTLSARSKDWSDPSSFSDVIVGRYAGQQVFSGAVNQYSLFVPEGAASFRIRLLPNSRSPDPFPGLPIYVRHAGAPTDADLIGTNNVVNVPPDLPIQSGVWNYAVGNLTPSSVSYDILTVITVTNEFGSYFSELKKLNDGVGPYYRYESGTSQAAPAVTGLLALFEEYFERQGRTPSPALLKALLINGARSVGSLYNFAVSDINNLQGWGVVNLTNSLPAADLDSPTGAVQVVQFADHTGTNSLVTGQSRTWRLEVDPSALDQIVKFTLVWTDPPGNPNAGVKLVNDLDLEVRNVDTGETFVGNDIPYRSDFNTPHPTGSTWTNDFVNNVENILIRPPLGTNYTVTVRARRVNVNAVTTHPKGIAQDFALAASVEVPGTTNALTFTRELPDIAVNVPNVQLPTNGLALLTQRAGANPPYLARTAGATNQWTFFVFTNLQTFTPENVGLTNGSNVAFITFLPPNLGRPRNLQADLDLYVSRDPRLFELEPTVLDKADKSTKPGGTELVFYTNAPLGAVFYIGVKAEDQQAGEFGFVALSSNQPFDEEDEFGNRIVHGLPYRLAIPDGSPDLPQAAYVFGIATVPFPVQGVVVTNTLSFDSTGDILGNLSHNGVFSVLNSHALDPSGRGGFRTIVYDDSNSGRTSYGSLIARPTDGPGKLTDFTGTDATGPWILSLVDNAVTQTATNLSLTLLLQPQIEDDGFYFSTVQPNSEDRYYIDVPANATNLVVTLTGINPNVPLFVAVRRGAAPSFAVYDKGATFDAPGGVLTLGTRDVPPLNSGRWYVSVMNPNGVPVNYGISIRLELDLTSSTDRSFSLDKPLPVVDDARRTSTITVPDDYEIADIRVGLRVNHPRVSDLVFHLISPRGTRLLLSENRGGPDGTAYGVGTGDRRIYTTFTDRTNLTFTPIKFGVAPFTNSARPSGASNLVVIADSFERAVPAVYATGQGFPSYWLVNTGAVQVVQVPAGDTNVIDGLQYVSFPPEGGSFGTILNLTASRLYRLRYYAGLVAPPGTPQGLQVYVDGRLVQELRSIDLQPGWNPVAVQFAVPNPTATLEFRSTAGLPGLAVDAVVVEEAEPPLNAYYLPEEELKPILGERSAGDWRLEITDTRAGPAAGGLGDFDWRLELVYALPTINAIQLTNNVPYFGVVSGLEIQYFYVEVPNCATISTNLLAGQIATLALFGDQDGLPIADLDTFYDDYGPFLNFEAGGLARFTLTTNTPLRAPLEPGQRYYLAVRNYQLDLTNNAFGIMVQFDCEDPPLPVVPALTNGVPVIGTILPGSQLDYYQFTVSTNAIRADFELEPLNGTGNVDLYVRYGRIDDFPLPSPNQYDYKSEDPSPAVIDSVAVTRTSFPVALTPGVWYVAVRNADTVPVNYSVRVTETTTPLILLTNGVALTSRIAPVDPLVGLQATDLQYYAFLVSPDSVNARFETFGADGDVNLYVRRGAPIATPYDYHFAGLNPGITDEVIQVANTNTPVWLDPGWWFLTVENADVADVNYSIRATEFPAKIIPLVNDVPVTNTVAAGGASDYYSFPVSPNALSARFEVFGMTDDVQLLLRPGLPVPTFNDYTYAGTNAGTAPEQIELTPYSFPVGLSPGNWYLSVVNPGTNNAAYTVRASEVTVNVIPLTNSVAYNAAIAGGPGMDYYQFEVHPNASAAEFKLTSAGAGDLDLFLRKGPPLPNAANSHYAGANPGRVDELIRIDTNSLPVPLSPGTWYLAVTNKEAAPVGYEITATEFLVEPPPISGQITNIVIETNRVCITWISIPGTNYFVVAKTNIMSPVWTPVSFTIPAVDTTTTWCLEPLGPWRFFDVREGVSPTEPLPDPVPVLTLRGTDICVSWSSVVGTNYFVEAKRAVTDPDWTVLAASITAGSTNTEACFPIDWGYRVFRVGVGERLPPAPTPLPPELVTVEFQVGQVCVGWPSRAGLDYLVLGKLVATDPNWTVISEPLPGTGQRMSLCLDGGTGFRVFQVIEGVSVPPSAPPSVPVPNVTLTVDAAFQLCLTWDTLAGAEYFVEGKERIADPVWTVISPILEAQGLQLSYCQPLNTPWRYLRVRRVNAAAGTPPEIDIIEMTAQGPHLRWSGPAGARYRVFYSDSVPPVWLPANGTVTSVTTTFDFIDDGTQAGALGAFRIYRIEQLP